MSWVTVHGNVASYSLAYQALPGGEEVMVMGIRSDMSSYVLDDLEKWTEYVVWVRAHTDKGPGMESPAARTRTQEDGMLKLTASLGLLLAWSWAFLLLLLLLLLLLVLHLSFVAFMSRFPN